MVPPMVLTNNNFPSIEFQQWQLAGEEDEKK